MRLKVPATSESTKSWTAEPKAEDNNTVKEVSMEDTAICCVKGNQTLNHYHNLWMMILNGFE